ncbi:hypothetical protein ACFLZW_06320, partial [Chloroflexota bacterium]
YGHYFLAILVSARSLAKHIDLFVLVRRAYAKRTQEKGRSPLGALGWRLDVGLDHLFCFGFGWFSVQDADFCQVRRKKYSEVPREHKISKYI